MSEEPDNVFTTSLLNNLMETWILPAIRKRQSAGQLPTPIVLKMAQIIFKLDESPPLVRINDEVRGEAKFEPKAGCAINVGDAVFENQVERLLTFKLPDEERDWGHATTVVLRSNTFIAFDFIYNKRLSEEHLDAAREFFQSAIHALKSKLDRAFIENLASASELAAKAFLLSRPDRSIITAKSHSKLHNRLNAERRIGNIEDSYVEAFNQLYQLRYPARYLDSKFDLSGIETNELLNNIQAFIDQVARNVRIAR